MLHILTGGIKSEMSFCGKNHAAMVKQKEDYCLASFYKTNAHNCVCPNCVAELKKKEVNGKH